jgi:hypothetical protein
MHDCEGTMKITATTLMMALTGIAAHAGEGTAAQPGRSATVCMESGPFPGVAQARLLASEMFAAIGIRVRWRQGLGGCPSGGILISLADGTPARLMPGALAYALPYEGRHIRVFYDRSTQHNARNGIPVVLGHVLVHEITHILQGISRHSATGIMKARWDQRDFDFMDLKCLKFTREDVDLIYRGLAVRLRHSVAMKTETAVAMPQPGEYD